MVTYMYILSEEETTLPNQRNMAVVGNNASLHYSYCALRKHYLC